jgi:hypothetical protein
MSGVNSSYEQFKHHQACFWMNVGLGTWSWRYNSSSGGGGGDDNAICIIHICVAWFCWAWTTTVPEIEGGRCTLLP